MKRSAILIICLCMLSLNACAQWYLFPGKNRKKAADKVEDKTAVQEQSVTEQLPEIDTTALASISDEYVFEELDGIGVDLILPINAVTKPSSNFLEMYGGSLLAVRDIAADGTGIRLNVVDSGSGDKYGYATSGSDLTIGPVATEQLRDLLLERDGFIVSPLEPKASSLTESFKLIQAPTPWSCQYDRIADWVTEFISPDENIVVFQDSVEVGEQARYLLDRLNENGVRYSIAKRPSESVLPKGCSARCLIASDRDEYISGMVKLLSAFVVNGRYDGISLYGTSKLKGAASDQLSLHRLNCHLALAYFIDYESDAVKDFVLKYRAVFNDEPGSFAFQGYDTMRYFLRVCKLYGKQWYKKLSEYKESGLQAVFDFPESESEGYLNKGIRTVILNRDLSTTVQ